MKLKGESIFSLVLIIFFSYINYASRQLPSVQGGAADVGVNFFPILISSMCIILTGITFISSLIKSKEEVNKHEEGKNSFLSTFLVVSSVVLILTFYVILLPKIGFIISTTLFLVMLTALMYKFKTNKMIGISKLIKSIIFLFTLAFIVNFIFAKVFKIILP
ncbi:tripartite tricarboxylate transporter TctB family protein [Halocella sp. SP3-1]|uniref:tripartite tricarboxylate transporter TctB family protein n=1 Tax=Halocella sp. SP3-1 TaxID=2382161 RepID=UPI0013DEF44B|nr:tripartite tricarboxylate transporter TctB family protein [Halocella sp. SP3-1]